MNEYSEEGIERGPSVMPSGAIFEAEMRSRTSATQIEGEVRRQPSRPYKRQPGRHLIFRKSGGRMECAGCNNPVAPSEICPCNNSITH